MNVAMYDMPKERKKKTQIDHKRNAKKKKYSHRNKYKPLWVVILSTNLTLWIIILSTNLNPSEWIPYSIEPNQTPSHFFY